MSRPKGSKNRLKIDLNGDVGAKPGRQGGASAGNGYDQEELKRIVANIEMELAGIDELHAGIAEGVASCRAAIGGHYEIAKELGIPVKALKAAIKMRRLEAKLSEVQRDELDQIRFALGDLMGTPLGEWAKSEGSEAPRAIEHNPSD